MKSKAQEIAIAEACGALWQEVPQLSGDWYNSITEEEQESYKRLHPKRILSFKKYDFDSPWCAPLPFPDANGDATSIPDYLNDLNAIHQAILKLPDSSKFGYYLDQVIWEVDRTKLVSGLDRLKATAAQLGEAFLKTLGLWVED